MFDLWKNKNKRITWFWESRFIVEIFFVIFVIICMFFLFLNNKTKIKLSEQENKSVGALGRRWITTKTINLHYRARK